MNERIKELAEQVGLPMGVTEPQWHYEPAIYQLAELIVRECIEVGSKAFCKDSRIVSIFPANQIKEQFGVE